MQAASAAPSRSYEQVWCKVLCQEDYPPSTPFRRKLLDVFLTTFSDKTVQAIRDEQTNEACRSVVQAIVHLVASERLAREEASKARMQSLAFTLVESILFVYRMRAQFEAS